MMPDPATTSEGDPTPARGSGPPPSHDILKVRSFVILWLSQTLVMWVLGRLVFGASLPTGFVDWWSDSTDSWYLTTIGVHASVIAAVQGMLMLPARPPGFRSARVVPWRQHLLSALVIGLLCAGVYAVLIAMYDTLDFPWLDTRPQLHGFLVSASMVFLVGSTGAFLAFGVLIVWFKERTPLGLVASICALCSAALLGGLGYIGCAIWRVSHGEETTDRELSTVLAAIIVMWVFATPLLGSFLRRQPGETRLHLVAKRLFIGSVVETVSMIPLDVMVRRKSNCYCGEGTFWALVICSTVGLIALGPMIFLLPLGRRRRRLELDCCPLCGYDMSATPKAERCPECGAGWRPSSSAPVDPGA